MNAGSTIHDARTDIRSVIADFPQRAGEKGLWNGEQDPHFRRAVTVWDTQTDRILKALDQLGAAFASEES